MVLIPATCSAVPLSPLPTRTFLVSEITRAVKRVAELVQKHPSWPQSRVRATVARELNVSTVQLRYMLSKAPDAN